MLIVLGLAEKCHQIASQVAKACDGDLGVLLSLGEDEGALQNSLHEVADTFGAPCRIGRVALFCCFDILRQHRDMF